MSVIGEAFRNCAASPCDGPGSGGQDLFIHVRGHDATMSRSVFSAQSLSGTYSSGEVAVHALQGLDLEISAGEVVVLPGPSGSGKSTLLNIMKRTRLDERSSYAFATSGTLGEPVATRRTS